MLFFPFIGLSIIAVNLGLDAGFFCIQLTEINQMLILRLGFLCLLYTSCILKHELRKDDHMTELIQEGVYLEGGRLTRQSAVGAQEAAKNTMAYQILQAHNTSKDEKKLKIKFDAMASHDITYVGIIQTARASGLTEFPLPYVLTNCHNSLCAVGGTINEDDHVFGLSAAEKYGGIYVPAHQAVIHSYMRETCLLYTSRRAI